MFRIYGTRNVSIRGHIYFENRKNLVFDIGLKTAVIFGQIIFKKWQTAEKNGWWNVCIWRSIYFENQRMLAFDIGLKCSGYPVHEMCVYGEAYIRHVTLSNCQRGQIKIWLKT